MFYFIYVISFKNKLSRLSDNTFYNTIHFPFPINSLLTTLIQSDTSNFIMFKIVYILLLYKVSYKQLMMWHQDFNCSYVCDSNNYMVAYRKYFSGHHHGKNSAIIYVVYTTFPRNSNF